MSGARLVWLVARREIIERARTRSFQISTVLLIGIIVATVAAPALFAADADVFRVGLVGTVPVDFRQTVESGAERLGVVVVFRDLPDAATSQAALADGEVDAVLRDGALLMIDDGTSPELVALLDGGVQAVRRIHAVEQLGLDPGQVSELLAPQPLEVRSLDDRNPRRRNRGTVAFVGSALMYGALLLYGTWVLFGVIEEKSSRVVEVLLAAMRPRHLLTGKILGIGTLAVLQLIAVLAAAAAAGALFDVSALSRETAAVVGLVSVWFLLGFAFYSAGYGVVGALVSRQEEAQNASTPLTLLLVGAYAVAFIALQNPNGLAARIGSLFPPTAPTTMPVRAALGDVALWEIPASIIIMVLAIYWLLRLGGRVYGGAILRSGARVKLRDAWRSAEL